jgi:hypothetical protein
MKNRDGVAGYEGEPMTGALRALLAGLIDYAGMFPPAKLPLPEALRNYLRYRAGPEAWMLGRFICPAARLAELAPFHDEIGADRPLVVAALGRSGDTFGPYPEFLQDLSDILECTDRHNWRIVIDVLESRLSGRWIEGAAVDLTLVASKLNELNLVPLKLSPFFEAAVHDREALGIHLSALRNAPFEVPAGFKLRAGGLTAAAFPSSEQVAFALTTCLAEDLPFKATAGLHHPFPRFDAAVQARMHGFINLFVAGTLIHARGIDISKTTEILDDADPAHFHFDDTCLRWCDLTATLDEIREARKLLISFGSCSFDEPRDDLRALGWL